MKKAASARFENEPVGAAFFEENDEFFLLKPPDMRNT